MAATASSRPPSEKLPNTFGQPLNGGKRRTPHLMAMPAYSSSHTTSATVPQK
jgi:hypothetical protein